jgi:hypothetical protein
MEHTFGRTCRDNGIEHRTTKVKHPWTNGQVERMNRTIKEATVRRFHYDSHQQLEAHLADFVSAYNFARRLKTLKGLTPYEFICKSGQKSQKIQARSSPSNAGTKHMSAACTIASISRPCVSTRTCRFLPLIFLPLSKPGGSILPPLFRHS